MTTRKKIVLVWMIIKQVLFIAFFALCLFIAYWDDDWSKLSIILEPPARKIGELVGPFFNNLSDEGFIAALAICYFVPVFLFLGVQIAYSITCKFLQYSYLISWIIVKFTCWTIFIPPVALVIWAFCLIVPIALCIWLSVCLPIVPGLIYIFAIDRQPKQEIFNNYSE